MLVYNINIFFLFDIGRFMYVNVLFGRLFYDVVYYSSYWVDVVNEYSVVSES